MATEMIGDFETVTDAEIILLRNMYRSIRNFDAHRWMKHRYECRDECGSARGVKYTAFDAKHVELSVYIGAE